MPVTIEFTLTPEQAARPDIIKELAAQHSQIRIEQIAEVRLLRKSLDARKPQIIVLLKVDIYVLGEPIEDKLRTFQCQAV